MRSPLSLCRLMGVLYRHLTRLSLPFGESLEEGAEALSVQVIVEVLLRYAPPGCSDVRRPLGILQRLHHFCRKRLDIRCLGNEGGLTVVQETVDLADPGRHHGSP